MPTILRQRRDTAANWSSANPVVPDGQLCFDTTNDTFRIGDGTTNYSSLPVQSGVAGEMSGANNLSEVVSAPTARANLGLVIGTDVQAFDSTIVVDADIGSTVQAYDADLATVSSSGIGTSANQIVQLNGSAELPAVSGANLTNLPAGGAASINELSDGFWSATYSTLGLGLGALSNHSSGYWNVAIGANSMNSLTSGNYSVAVGYHTLTAMTTARDCTAIGYTALKLATGQRNTGVGYAAGKTITTGENNSCIGNSAQAPSATDSNSFTLGNTSVSNLRCNDTSISSLSDQRDKTNIQDIPDSAGIDFINKLRPVTYHWDRREWYDDGTPDGSKIKADWQRWKPNSGLKQGFIAQEVQTAISGEKCLEDSMIVTDGNPDKLEFAPQHLLTNAIKAIQQLSAENKALLARIESLEN